MSKFVLLPFLSSSLIGFSLRITSYLPYKKSEPMRGGMVPHRLEIIQKFISPNFVGIIIFYVAVTTFPFATLNFYYVSKFYI